MTVTAPFTRSPGSSDTTLSLASINRPGLSSPGQQAAACHIVGLACERPVVSSAVLCDGNVPLTMSLETRSNSALMKRAEQLKRWQDSETAREPGDLKRKKRRIGFSDGCVFLAACAACDRDEVRSLISRGTDIDTANVDGLTALHQVRAVSERGATIWQTRTVSVQGSKHLNIGLSTSKLLYGLESCMLCAAANPLFVTHAPMPCSLSTRLPHIEFSQGVEPYISRA